MGWVGTTEEVVVLVVVAVLVDGTVVVVVVVVAETGAGTGGIKKRQIEEIEVLFSRSGSEFGIKW